ncbi:MAG: outer membrane beta-barrel protein [Bdellovibrionales bacterium]|nr:outer membrane beta-barrel protein [Bdellovibrionales bacterium]
MLKRILFCVALLPTLAQAQNFESAFSAIGLRGITGYAGFGFASYEVTTPSDRFRMDQGIFVYAGVERRFGTSPFFITAAFNYLKTNGESFYDYTTLGGTQYTGQDIGYSASNYQIGMGLKMKLFADSWARPYLEGGGLFGYHELTYTKNLETITGGSGYKRKDGLTGLGYYGEGGIEVDFAETAGIKVGLRYQETTTRPFETLANQKLKFESTIFQIAFLKKF